MREKTIEKYLVDRVKAKKGWAVKLLSTVSGLPDRLVLLPKGQIFFAELKSTGQKPRTIQRAIHRRLRSLGFSVFVFDNKKDIDEVLEGF